MDKTKFKLKILLAFCVIFYIATLCICGVFFFKQWNENNLGARTGSNWNLRLGSYLETKDSSGYNILINGINKYLNFNSLSGTTGYGFRDNAGQMEVKDSGGSWTGIGSGSSSNWLDYSDWLTPSSTSGIVVVASSTFSSNLKVGGSATLNADAGVVVFSDYTVDFQNATLVNTTGNNAGVVYVNDNFTVANQFTVNGVVNANDDMVVAGNATTTLSMDAGEFCLSGANCISDWSSLAGAANWDILTNKPATSTILALLDSDYRILKLNATSSIIDTLLNKSATSTISIDSPQYCINGTDCIDAWADIDTDTHLTEEEVEDFVGGMLGGTEDGISVAYNDGDNDIDFTLIVRMWSATD